MGFMSEAPQFSLLTAHDRYLFNEGSHFRLYEILGARIVSAGVTRGTYFAVWAPNAEWVSLIGEFNGWNQTSHLLQPKGDTGARETLPPATASDKIRRQRTASPVRSNSRCCRCR